MSGARLGSAVMAGLWSILPHVFEGRDPAAVGVPGEANFAISLAPLFGLWTFGVVITAAWTIWTEFTLSQES